MSNLAVEDTDKLEELPLRDKFRTPDGWRRWGEDYPYKKVYRFLTSRVGRYWNDVFSEFCHLEWIPAQYKTKEQIGHTVILNTFMKDGRVWYYESYGCWNNNERPLEEGVEENETLYYTRQDSFYVHPKTGRLCFKQKKGGYDRKKKWEEDLAKWFRLLGDYHQLVKVKGVWYEVKAVPLKSDIVEVNGLHYRYVKEQTIEQKQFKMGLGIKVTQPDDLGYVRINGRLAVPYREARWEGKQLGPKDCLVDGLPQSRPERSYYPWTYPNYRSVKITTNRQLSHKDLKKYGLTNDPKVIGKRCKVCGNTDCVQQHNTEWKTAK